MCLSLAAFARIANLHVFLRLPDSSQPLSLDAKFWEGREDGVSSVGTVALESS